MGDTTKSRDDEYGRVLWQPSPERAAATQIRRFAAAFGERIGLPLSDYASLHRASLEHRDAFWTTLVHALGLVFEGDVSPVVVNGDCIEEAAWFPAMRINFAENLLQGDADATAIVARAAPDVREAVTTGELRARVAKVAGWLRQRGVLPGDRVAVVLPNAIPAVVAMLAANAVGAVASLSGLDLGVEALVDRFGQIGPRVLVAAPGAAPSVDPLRRIRTLADRLPTVDHVLVVQPSEPITASRSRPTLTAWQEVLAGPDVPLAFTRLPFSAPAFVLYTSGTTGPPKCIVHGMGGMLVQLLKEHRLHYDLRDGGRFFYQTSPGWNMWYWVATALGARASVVLWDGSPIVPRATTLFDLVDEEGIGVFGISPAYLSALRASQAEPRRTHDLGTLRTILSTGSPLPPSLFDWVYANVKRDVCLSSISGGTEINACFGTGDPSGPVRRGEMQVLALGMRVEIFGDDGARLDDAVGELVATAPFPSQPVGFWNDPDGARLHETYFARFPGVWHHGDLARITPCGGLVIEGRSDATLKPAGHRIGTAEIYRVVEELPEIAASIAIGQRWNDDVRIVLFVQLAPGAAFDGALEARIRRALAQSASPLHVPSRILVVPDIPLTVTGKRAELAVRAVVHGDAVKGEASLANPEALAHFRARPELAV